MDSGAIMVATHSRSLTPDQADLAARHAPLARRLARHRARKLGPFGRRHREDFSSIAILALCTSARDYRTPSSIAFATYARFRIKECLAHAFPIPAPLTIWPEGYRVEADCFLPWATPIDRPDREQIDRESATALLRRLPWAHAESLRLTVVEALSQTEAGRSMGLSQTEISRLIRQSRSLMGA
jgi:RNA polymerase sigma factor (sigma-70 family)